MKEIRYDKFYCHECEEEHVHSVEECTNNMGEIVYKESICENCGCYEYDEFPQEYI